VLFAISPRRFPRDEVPPAEESRKAMGEESGAAGIANRCFAGVPDATTLAEDG
jgi:hypothetical protein